MSDKSSPTKTHLLSVLGRAFVEVVLARSACYSLLKFCLLATFILCCPACFSLEIPILLGEDRQIPVQENLISSIVFGNNKSIKQIQSELEEIIQSRIARIVSECELNLEQRKKLQVAATGDIQRFMNNYESLQRMTSSGLISQREYEELQRRALPLRKQYSAGLHLGDSLFAKSISYVLDEKQLNRYAEFERQRRERKYESMVKGTIAMIESELPLTRDQRSRLLTVILERDPPQQVDAISHYHICFVIHQISKIPEEQLHPIFLKNEWKAVQKIVATGKSYELLLKREGLLED